MKERYLPLEFDVEVALDAIDCQALPGFASSGQPIGRLAAFAASLGLAGELTAA